MSDSLSSDLEVGSTARQITQQELTDLFRPLVQETKRRMDDLSGGDPELLWALRRKLTKELVYEEGGMPVQRKVLKAQKWGEQGGKCAVCQSGLPTRGVVLDRVVTMLGNTVENTRLLCPACDAAEQAKRGYR
jgi:hypothetical protein